MEKKLNYHFSNQEYETRLVGLRSIIDQQGLDAIVLTSCIQLDIILDFCIALLVVHTAW